jgi:hypothetical protein
VGHVKSKKRIPLCQKCFNRPERHQAALDVFAELVKESEKSWTKLSKKERERLAKRAIKERSPREASRQYLWK